MRANGEWSLVVPSWDSHRRAITTADRRSVPLPIDHDQQDEPGKRQKNGSPGSPFPPCVAAQITGAGLGCFLAVGLRIRETASALAR
jgi:hypothetical protein